MNRNSITDVAELLDAPDAKQYALEWVGRVSNAKEPARQLSSVTFLRPGLPPIFTIHGDQDDVLGQGQARCVLPSIRWVSTTG